MTNETKILDAWKVFQRAEKALVEASAGGTRGKALAKEITDRSEAREALLSLLEPGKVYEVADRVGIAAATESGFLLADLELVDVRERSADTRRIFYVEGKLTDETFERLKAAIAEAKLKENRVRFVDLEPCDSCPYDKGGACEIDAPCPVDHKLEDRTPVPESKLTFKRIPEAGNVEPVTPVSNFMAIAMTDKLAFLIPIEVKAACSVPFNVEAVEEIVKAGVEAFRREVARKAIEIDPWKPRPRATEPRGVPCECGMGRDTDGDGDCPACAGLPGRTE